MLIIGSIFDRIQKITLDRCITPSNLAEAKAAWIKGAEMGNFTNPSLIYGQATVEEADRVRQANLAILSEAEEFTLRATDARTAFLGELAIATIRRQLLATKIVKSILAGDDAQTNALMQAYYGKVSPELSELAGRIAFGGEKIENPHLAEEQILTQETLDKYANDLYAPTDMRKLFMAVLEDYRLQDEWNVIIDDSRNCISVCASDEHGHSLFIPTTRKAENLFKVIQLAAHEIETHIRHQTNCINLFMQEFGLSEDAATKVSDNTLGVNCPYVEGLAKMADARINRLCYGNNSGEPHPWFTLAIIHALGGDSFAQVAEWLHSNGKSLDFCFNITVRVFRGCNNTSNPHRFSRQADRSYLEGYVESIKRFDDVGVFNFGRFNLENQQKIETVLGRPLAEIHPRIIWLDKAKYILKNL